MIGAVGGCCGGSSPLAALKQQATAATKAAQGLDADGDGDGGADDVKSAAQASAAALPPLQLSSASATNALLAFLQSDQGQSALQQVVTQVMAAYQGGGNAAEAPSLSVVG